MLLVCTANRCRSPMAEVLLRQHLAVAGIDADVSSAGLYEGGAPATSHGIAAMAGRGLDLGRHRSRRLDAAAVASADLILGMAREHVREVAVLDPGALARSFTLKELVSTARAVGPRRPDEPFDEWLGRVASARRVGVHVDLAPDPALDVADPVGRGRDDYEVTAAELDDLLARVVELAWPTAGARSDDAPDERAS